MAIYTRILGTPVEIRYRCEDFDLARAQGRPGYVHVADVEHPNGDLRTFPTSELQADEGIIEIMAVAKSAPITHCAGRHAAAPTTDDLFEPLAFTTRDRVRAETALTTHSNVLVLVTIARVLSDPRLLAPDMLEHLTFVASETLAALDDDRMSPFSQR